MDPDGLSSCASSYDSLISLSYSMAVFSANLFGPFLDVSWFFKGKKSVKMHFSYHFCKIFVNKKIVNKCDDCCCELFYLNADDREKMHFCLRYFVTTYKHAIWCTFCVLNFYLKTAGRLVATRIATRIGKCLDSPKKHHWNHYVDGIALQWLDLLSRGRHHRYTFSYVLCSQL